MIDPTQLPAGLKMHCACGIVVPTDAPEPEGGDCAFIARHRIAGAFNPAETHAGQHAQAVAAWSLIHDASLRAGTDATAKAYHLQFQRERKAHFAASAVRAGVADEHVAAGKLHRRDRSLF